jgi:hypothetical protein
MSSSATMEQSCERLSLPHFVVGLLCANFLGNVYGLKYGYFFFKKETCFERKAAQSIIS